MNGNPATKVGGTGAVNRLDDKEGGSDEPKMAIEAMTFGDPIKEWTSGDVQ